MGNVTEKFADETPSTPLQYGSSPNQTSEWIDASDASPIVKVHFIKGSPVETLGSHLRFERQSNVAIPLPPPSTTSSSTMITDMGEEEGKESDGEVEESTSSSAPPPTLDIPTSSTETRDAAMATEEEEDDEEEEEEEATPTNPRLSTDNTNEAKRQKKRERKRAKQANKEQQQERQRLQRIQAIRCRQEKLERDAAVVAKEIVDVEEERSRSSSPYSSPEEMAANQPSPRGTFEVLVHGKRRSVVPFVPRRQAPPFEIPEHSSPVVVPFRDAAPILRPMIPFVAYPPPPPPPPPPLLIRPPLPFPTFVSVQPPTFPQPMVPVSMQRIPMQRMPVMINRPPIFLPPPPPPPPPPMLIFPRQLVRPARCPLSITAPEDVKKEEEEKKKAETVRKFMEKVREVALEPAAPEAEEEKEGANATSSSTTVATSNATSSATLDSNLGAATTWEDEYSEETPPAASEATVPPPNVISEATLLVTPIAAPDAAPDATPDAPPTSHQATPTDEPEDPIQLVEKKPKKPESPEPIEIRRRSSVELNGELITAGVAAVLLDDSDDELPPPAASSSSLSQRPPTPEAQEAINRVMEFPKQSSSSSSTFDIWTGFVSEMPTAPKALREEWDEEFREILEKDKRMIEKMDEEGEEPVTLMSICKRIEPFFKESKWHGATIDGEQLREMFIEAYGGAIPRDHWSILELVCSFQPGYFHVFDVVIGSVIELTYNFILTPEFKKNEDSLWRLYQSVPAAEGVEKFFQRFEQKILPELINFVSSRYLSVRTFVAIAEVINPTALTVSDLYYLATLVFGARQFYQKFNARFTRLHIIETGGNRWIRQTTMDPLKKPSAPGPGRMISVGDFLTRLRPHIDDILQILPDAVVNDEEFFAVAKLVCGWNGGHEEERIWESIRLDRAKFQEFHEAYRPFFRIEIRMGTIYLRKLTYDDDYDDLPLDIETTPSESCLISAIKSYSSPEDPEKKEKKKGVSYAAEIELITPESPTSTSRCTQTSHLNTDQLWSLEREVIRLLKRDNEPFAAFIETKEAREMFRYQFLIDVFKQKDLHYLAYILERTLQETREEAWKETTALRNAAEEAQILLELAREQHRKEFGELQTRMETISRFEAFEVEVASNTRIDGLKERIKELQQDREVMLREEVKEERARQARQLREMKEKHKEEKRAFANEIQRLREENARLIAERDEMASRCENQMNKAKQMCETSSRLLLDSQREIHSLRGTALDPNRPSTSAAFYSSSIPSPSPVEMTPEAKRQMKIMMKYAAEIDVEELRSVARGLLEEYTEIGANHKERKTAEKQLKEFEAILEDVDIAIKENIQMIKLNVVEGLIPIPTIPTPFSETVLNKMRALRREKKKEEELFERSEEEEDGCLICTEPVEEGDDVVRCGTCAKEYHYGCISKWLKINSVCPQCSRALKDPNEYPELE